LSLIIQLLSTFALNDLDRNSQLPLHCACSPTSRNYSIIPMALSRLTFSKSIVTLGRQAPSELPLIWEGDREEAALFAWEWRTANN
jgi:hypothetical protein